MPGTDAERAANAPRVKLSPTALDIDAVVKLGGGVLARVEQFSAVLAVIAAAATARRLLVIPGGGPFADTVREVERRLPLPDDAAHWMAILGIEQYAHLIATRLPGGVLVDGPSQIAGALQGGQVPVLAPYRWMRAADPLPHSWDVTSDSIAAWIAGAVGARRLVLVKPPGAERGDLVDAYFHRALPDGLAAVTVAADRLDRIDAALRGGVE